MPKGKDVIGYAADKKCVMLLAWRCTAGNGRVAAGTPRSIAPIATTRVAATR